MDYKGYEQQLRPEDEYSLGSWFLIPDIYLRKLEKPNQRFSHNWNKSRRVVLATRSEPSAVLFFRTSTGKSGHHHRPHRHGANRRCEIDKVGRVVLNVPVTILDSSLLNNTSFSCIEPDGTDLLEAIRNAIEARPS